MLVYLPILSLRGIEGKMFRPMAWTVIFALGTALVLALTLMPVLASIFLRRGVSEKETFLIRWAKKVYRPLLQSGHGTACPCCAELPLPCSPPASGSRKTWGPCSSRNSTKESLAIQAIRLPSVSLESSVVMTGDIERTLRQFQPVESVISKTGRPEIATDPMTVNLTDIIINLKPRDEWVGFASKDELVDAMQAALDAQTSGNAYSFSQPIELRVQELIAGVRADVGISLYGDDLETLADKAEEIAAVLESIPGAADVGTEQVAGLALSEGPDQAGRACPLRNQCTGSARRRRGHRRRRSRRSLRRTTAFSVAGSHCPRVARESRTDPADQGRRPAGTAHPAGATRRTDGRRRTGADQPRFRATADAHSMQRARARSRRFRGRRTGGGGRASRAARRIQPDLGRPVQESAGCQSDDWPLPCPWRCF